MGEEDKEEGGGGRTGEVGEERKEDEALLMRLCTPRFYS